MLCSTDIFSGLFTSMLCRCWLGNRDSITWLVMLQKSQTFTFGKPHQTLTPTSPRDPTWQKQCQPFFCHSSAPKHPPLNEQTCSSVARSISCAILAELRKRDPACIPSYLVQRVHSVMKAVARIIYSTSRHEHVTLLLHKLHWLRAPQ